MNSLKEILKRLLFIVYIGSFTAYLIFCVGSLARHGKAEITGAVLFLMTTLGIRCAGYRWLDFGRLCKSFPSGCARDCIPEAVRDEVERLVAEFHEACDWPRRVEIRHRLIELEEQQPEIIEAYETELRKVLAS